jgi:hypothetical protein
VLNRHGFPAGEALVAAIFGNPDDLGQVRTSASGLWQRGQRSISGALSSNIATFSGPKRAHDNGISSGPRGFWLC